MNWKIGALIPIVVLLIGATARAAVYGDVDSIPREPRSFTTICFPVNYRQDAVSQELLRALGSHPAFVELRRVSKVTTYAANDPDFQHRWAARLPQVQAGRPCIVISCGDAYTPQQLIYGRDVGSGALDAVAADIERVLPRLRGTRPQQPTFALDKKIHAQNVSLSSRLRPRRPIFRPRPFSPCPDGVCPPDNPTPMDDAPVRPLLPPMDDPIMLDQPIEPTDGIAPPAPAPDLIQPEPTTDPRIDEQAERIEKQAAEIQKLQSTIVELRQIVQTINVNPARDYAPDINALKGDVQSLKNVQAVTQQVKVEVEALKVAQVEQQKVNAELVDSIQTLVQQRTEIINQLATVKKEMAIDIDKLAPEVANRLTHSATIMTLDGKTKLQTKPLNEPLEFVQRQRGIK